MIRVLVVSFILFLSAVCLADLESTSTLPAGVFSPKFIFGFESGLEERYNSVGLLEGVADQYHFDMTGSSLAKLVPQLSQLVGVLNGYSPNEKLGDELTLGTMDFKAAPTINYFAPTLSYGVSPNFSIGVGIPIIHYHNSMQVVSSGGNAQALSNYVSGSNPDVTAALNGLVAAANNLTSTLNSVLAAKGYLPLREVDFTQPGDVQISGVYRYYFSKWWRLAIRPFIQLPTGHKNNDDDLMDISTGGQPAVGLYSIHDLVLSKNWSLVSSVGYQANIQDTVQVRVPDGPDDILPDASRDVTVRRKTGNTVFVEGGAAYIPWHVLELRALYDFQQKDPDWFDGDQGWDYGLLSQDTGLQTATIHGAAELSTVDWYLKKQFALPMIFGYVYGNTVYAVNAPNQITHQIYIRMFF